MNSTNEVDKEIRKLFDAFVLKAHQAVTNEGKEYFPLSSDKNASSYYESPQHPQQVYFSFIDVKNPDSLKNSFQELWAGSDKQEFLPMAGALSELAFKLQAVQGEQSTELSPFVYTLY
jgi:hypothetical protein